MTSYETQGSQAGTALRGVPAKRHAIMESALTVFLREGYARANVDVIASEAGVSKQTVYNHFGDKERLFHDVMETARASADAESVIDDTLLRKPDRLRSDLVKVGKQLLDVLLDPKVAAVRRLLIMEAPHHPELNRRCGGGGGPAVPSLVQWFTLRIAIMAAQGELDLPDPDRAAGQFTALLAFEGQQLTQYGTTTLTREQADTISRSAADMFVRAYQPRSVTEPVRLES